MADVRSLEYPTLKVPYELLNKKFRAAQKHVDREVSHVQAAALELERVLHGDIVGASDISRLLGGMVEKLQVLKRKADESISEELEAAYVCKRRLEHLREHAASNGPVTSSSTTGTVNLWRKRRLDRMLVEYFLRRGYYGAATRLAHRSDLRDLTNIDVFLISREVEQSLAQHETSKCLEWCYDNRSKLRKLKSTMEFNLRIQEFVELVKADKRMDAVRHARKYFTIFEDEQLQDVQHCMALLAFPTNTELSPYKELLDGSRWERLIEQFRQDNYRLFQLASQSVFTVALQAGLSALKTPQCYSNSRDSRNPSCPVCQDSFNELAQPLPFAHCSQSRLVCTISGLPLNEHNLPMMLPNGYVYGEKALEQMANENNSQIICPKTKEVYPFKKLEKVFVM
ncbi:macrophage erythroblast attacher [Zootermopsis nevadensis]|uniref:E3 ubiquitin-protein transferase MAEA n=1 Tax=Zootermopsis nevadensis TaxID=136037 RepID=A0A067RDP7_ZOONE|nr:macrophage erythroblast attacher [Zootermopsis nevadensis]KDR16975.1 Macrophage erythroblast attacher [Zootermopsis nevadensis]